MMETPPSLAASPRHIDSQYTRFPESSPDHQDASYPAHLDPALQALDDPSFSHFSPQLDSPQYGNAPGHPYGIEQLYAQSQAPPPRQSLQIRSSHNGIQCVPQHPSPASPSGQFGILTPQNQLSNPSFGDNGALDHLRQEQNESSGANGEASGKKEGAGHFKDLKAVPNPPDLEAWRQRLFDVDQTIVMTEKEYVYISLVSLQDVLRHLLNFHEKFSLANGRYSFQVYFPHVDNVYSHRSTQRYKRQPFVSHYWDCRLKGRPPGTPKSDDPNKRKRKRQARQRDLCDVKIKIIEFLPGARQLLKQEQQEEASKTRNAISQGSGIKGQGGADEQAQGMNTFHADETDGNTTTMPGMNGERYYTIQRVNGNGGNGKGEGVAGPHKHNLEESDLVKKNSIHRTMAKVTKERKRIEVSFAGIFFTYGAISYALSPCIYLVPGKASVEIRSDETPHWCRSIRSWCRCDSRHRPLPHVQPHKIYISFMFAFTLHHGLDRRSTLDPLARITQSIPQCKY